MEVRSARVDDAEALAEVQTRSSREAYRGIMPAEHLDRMDVARRRRVWRDLIENDEAPAGTLVLEDAGEGVVGFVNVAAGDGLGEIRAVYVVPELWGRGGGRLLMAAGLERLAEAGYRDVVLWVLEKNARARRFYESAGWRADGTSRTDESRGVALVTIRYRLRI
ncbi:GNAT family N-acetyltransferase [Actinoplanes sp. NPDC023714]|uniref:GNAT family N-acetyltransferase n=1 Tax=Actinoplanes sp. NPDC023714 TaxID=3154322 RepID=UPI0033CB425A